LSGARIVLVALAAVGCSSSGGDAAATSAAGSDKLVIALRDHGRTVAVTRSTRITLVLPSRYRWSQPVSTGAHVEANETVSDAPTGGQVWELRAHETGRARLTTRGSPACRPATPGCPAAPRRYVVTLVVG
jgi:hypothetical protein